jgi:mersacidin/lichenicidin family type 2 lantibiotic
MDNEKIIRAWKNSEFRAGLSAAEQASLPKNPAGMTALLESELEDVSGGRPNFTTWITITCGFLCYTTSPSFC